MKEFLKAESGAVTVDWVVLTAAVTGMGIATVVAVSDGSSALAANIRTALSGAVNSAGIYLSGFNNVDGLQEAPWGWIAYGSFDGWTSETGHQIEIKTSGHQGVVSPDGGNMIDMDASPGLLSLGRIVEGLTAGQEYSVSFNAAIPAGNKGIDVYFGGELVGQVDLSSSTMTRYDFTFAGGSGDGSNALRLVATGEANNIGPYIHDVQIR